MPYIDEKARDRLGDVSEPAKSAGELNYRITMLAIGYMQHNGTGYAMINDVIGAIEGAKLEFYRRYAAPYEDAKIKENGDVY